LNSKLKKIKKPPAKNKNPYKSEPNTHHLPINPKLSSPTNELFKLLSKKIKNKKLANSPIRAINK